MTGDVLVPILITFLVVNVILLVRAGAKGQLGRLGGAAADRSPATELHAGPASDGAVDAASAAPDPPGDLAAAPPALPDPSGALEDAEPVMPDLPQIHQAPPSAGRDMLTGLDDEATWHRRVADESARVRRYSHPVTIVRLELDGLGSLTGLLGEEAGDRLLRAMADTLRRLARDTDHVARLGYGGFGVLMPETPEDAAVGYVERVGRACELWLASGAVAVRLAIGWAATSGEVDLVEIQQLATERMHGGQWRRMRRAGAVAAQPAVPIDAERSSVADAPAGVTPRLDREKRRHHKRDRRDRDRRR